MRQPLRILHLDSSPDTVGWVSKTLAGEGLACAMTHVRSPEEFAEALQGGDFDVLLSDCDLASTNPGMALAMARKIRPELPLIFLTSALGGHFMRQLLTAGAADCIQKNDGSRLAPSIRLALKEHEAREAKAASEAVLARSEAVNRAILEAIPDLIFRLDGKGTYLDFKPTTAMMKAGVPRQLTGLNISDTLPPDVAKEALRMISRTLAEESVQVFEYSLPEETGTRDYEARLSVYGPSEVLAIVRDITDRKAAEEALRRESRVREILSQVVRCLLEPDLEASLRSALRAIRVGLQLPRVVFRQRIDPNEDRQICDHAPDFVPIDDLNMPVWRGVEVMDAYLHGRVSIVADIRKQHWYERFRDKMEALRLGAYISVPCATADRYTHGILYLHSSTPREWSEDDVKLAVLVAAQLAAVVDRKRSEEMLKSSEQNYRRLFEETPTGNFVTDIRGRLVACNSAFARIFGFPTPEDAIGQSVLELYPDPKIREEYVEMLRRRGRVVESEMRMLRRDGRTIWILENAAGRFDSQGNLTAVQGSLTDITGRKQAEEQLEHRAFHDALTDMPNRALFLQRLRHAMSRAKAGKSSFSVFFLDLDRFKLINDSLGHAVGDRLLIQVARRLENCLRPGDTVARLGGDEFTVLIEGNAGESDVTRVAERILQDIAAPYFLDSHEVFTTASIGIVIGSPDYDHPDDVLRNADAAMYRAKARGRARFEIFHSSMHARSLEILQLESDLRRAIKRQEIQVYYQPKILLETGRVVGFEALARWFHPRRGLIMPDEFIPLAEETGLILAIGDRVLNDACLQMREWHARFPNRGPMTIGVNLSARQFQQPGLIKQIAGVLRETGLRPQSLNLEITESVAMEDAHATIHTLAELRDLGVLLEIDDFGTGYSSFSYLARFPVATLKIDKSFIRSLGVERDSKSIVQAIVTLASNLGMSITAEGVESEEQFQTLKGLACRWAQGNFFAAPLDSTKAEELLTLDPNW